MSEKKTYRVLRSCLAGGRPLTTGSVMSHDALLKNIDEKTITRLVTRGTLEAMQTPAAEYTAPPAPPAKAPGAEVTKRAPEPGEPADEEIDLTDMTREELNEEAIARGIPVKKDWKKADVIAAIEAHESAKTPAAQTVMKTTFDLDPAVLRPQSLENLNLLVAERTGGKQGPFQTGDECIAVLSRDYKGPRAPSA